MKIHLDREIITPPTSVPFPLQKLVKAGWHRFTVAAFLLGAGFLAWVLDTVAHKDWLGIIVPVYKQLFSPASGFLTVDLHGAGYALLAFLVLFLVGVLSAEIILPEEKDLWLKRLTTLLLGFGLVGTLSTFLAAFFLMRFTTLCITLIALLALLLIINIAFDLKNQARIFTRIKAMFRVWKIERDDFSTHQKKLLFLFCLIFFAIMEYQALRLIEIDWDALIYHANMAKIIFNNGGVPVIAGPSAGLELSANYPPLFSALGAYFYTFAGQFNDTYIRILAPIFSLLNLVAVYKIGSTLGSTRYGTIAVVLLVFTPLYFSRSLYATNYLPVTTFLTAALLFFLKWYQARQNRYWALFGLMFGFALLTSTHALVFGPSILILCILANRWIDRSERRKHWVHVLAALSLAFVIYGIWLLRNTIYVHNPIYPFGSQWLGGLHIDPVMFQRTVSSIRLDSLLNYFGTYTPSLAIYLQRLFLNRSQFPVISILLVLGALLIPIDQNRRGWALVGLFALPVGLLFASTLINIFPRYFVLIMPECALIVALLFKKVLDWGNFSFVTKSSTGRLRYRSMNATMHILAGILVGLTFVFPGNLAVVLGKQYGEADIYKPNYWPRVPGSQDVYGTLSIVYGNGVRAWEWLKPKTANNQDRVASFENRTYYLTDNVNSLFYLDGWEAKPLYDLSDPARAYAFLKAKQVKFVLDPYWIKEWVVYRSLPLNSFLGDPQYFPLVYDSPEARVYQVGQIADPLTDQSPLAISLSPDGWSQPELPQEFLTRRVEKNTTQARLFVSYAERITLTVGYFDAGASTVDINVKKPDGTWDYSTHIVLTNTNQWKTENVELPRIDHPETIEIGIFSESNDFLVNHLSARKSP